MNIIIKNGQELSDTDFEKTLALDRHVFGNEIITNDGMSLKRFLKFKEGLIAAYSPDNQLMGFINFFNVTQETYHRIFIKQEYIDDNLDVKDVISFKKQQANHILILDLVVDESFRNNGVSKQLHKSLWEHLRQKQQQNYQIENIFCFAITKGGHKIMTTLGSQAIWQKSGITLFKINQIILEENEI